VCALAPGASVTLSSWSDPEPSILLSVAGPRVGGAGPALVERIDKVSGTAWRDLTPNEITLEWRWAAAVPAQGGLRR
jgi:hypothetical protein